jgi:hypothetical protein
MGPVAVQASWSLLTLHEEPGRGFEGEDGEAERKRRMAMNVDTCHVWAADGDHLKAVEAGSTSGRPGWLVERLRSLGVDVDS